MRNARAFNLLDIFKKLKNKVMAQDVKGFMIDPLIGKFVLTTGSFGYTCVFTDEEAEFFQEPCTLTHEQFNRLMDLHIDVTGKVSNKTKILVFKGEKDYDFRNHIQDGLSVNYDKYDRIYSVISPIVADFDNLNKYEIKLPAMNVGKLKLALEAFTNTDNVVISSLKENGFDKPKISPVVIENLVYEENKAGVAENLRTKVGFVVPVHPYYYGGRIRNARVVYQYGAKSVSEALGNTV